MTDTNEKPKPVKVSGGAARTTLVSFNAKVGVSGPGYRIEAGKSGEVPAKYAEIHVADGHGEIAGGDKK